MPISIHDDFDADERLRELIPILRKQQSIKD